MARADDLDRTAGRLSRRTLGKAAIGAGALSGGLAAVAPAQRAFAQDDITLTFMHWGSEQEKTVVANFLKKFEDANPGIKVDQQHVVDENDSYNTRLNTLVASGQLPDVFYVNESVAFALAEQGVILDMTPYADVFKDRVPGSMYYFAPGRTFGGMSAVEMTLLFANRQLFEDAGVALPPTTADTAWTWDQLIETAKLLTKDRQGRNATDPAFDGENVQQYGVNFAKSWIAWYALVRSAGGDFTDEAGTTYSLNSPQSVDVFQKLQDLIYVHKVSPTPTAAEGLPATAQQLQTRRVAMTIDGQWNLLDISRAEVPLAVGVLPRINIPTTCIIGGATVVSATSAHLDAAVSLFKFTSDPANVMDLLTSGLWMPTETPYYTDPALVAQWVDNEVHPPEYRDAAMNYVLNNSVQGPVTIKNFPAISSRLDAHLDELWLGTKPAQQVLDEAGAELQPLLTGRYPTA
jgi:multiple sugar transport system substrate-binding protein